MSKLYHKRPSEIIFLKDEYTSYCFDEACAYITSRIRDKEKPIFEKNEGKNIEKPHYSSPSEMYANMGFKHGKYKKSLN